MNKKRAAWLVAALMTANGISGGVLAAGNQLDEVIVTADRYDADTAQLAPVASGMVGTKQNVGTLGSQDVLDTPFEQMTFTKKAMETFSQPQRSVMDVLSLSPSVRVTHGSTDTNLYIRGFSAGSGSWSMNGIPSMSHQMTMPTNYIYGSRRSTGRAKHWGQWDRHFYGRLCRRDGRRHNEKSTGKANAECGSFLV